MPGRIVEIGQLRNRRTDTIYKDKSVPGVAGFSERVLALLSEISLENESFKTEEFRKKLDEYRARIAALTSVREIETALEECLQVCRELKKPAGTSFQERESEFAQVIDLLQQAMANLEGQSDEYDDRIAASSERLSHLAKVNDIHELKRRIADETQELKKLVRERQKQATEGHARLSSRVDALQEKLSQTSKEASIDSLTRIANRGCFDRTLSSWTQNHRGGIPFVLALLDLDNFKEINDTHGHLVGDNVLQCASMWLGNDIRSMDFLARFGGDEFAVLLGGIHLADAEARLSRLLKRIGSAKFEYNKGRESLQVRFTASCGITQYVDGDTPEALLQRADYALYRAKKLGKNRVIAERKLVPSETARPQ